MIKSLNNKTTDNIIIENTEKQTLLASINGVMIDLGKQLDLEVVVINRESEIEKLISSLELEEDSQSHKTDTFSYIDSMKIALTYLLSLNDKFIFKCYGLKSTGRPTETYISPTQNTQKFDETCHLLLG